MSDAHDQVIHEVPGGASNIIAWFGSWPSFHDAEVVSLLLDREGESVLKVHYFRASGR
jgi:hypothetical protein